MTKIRHRVRIKPLLRKLRFLEIETEIRNDYFAGRISKEKYREEIKRLNQDIREFEQIEEN